MADIKRAGWQPNLARVVQAPGSRPRPWIIIAEEHAPAAVQLLVNIMNGDHPMKMRMEAATKLLMIAGTGFRGEVRTANNEPIANGRFRVGNQGDNVANAELLRQALRVLPEGAVYTGPEQVEAEKSVVMLHNVKQAESNGDTTQAHGGRFKGRSEPWKRGVAKPIVELELDEKKKLEEEAGYF